MSDEVTERRADVFISVVALIDGGMADTVGRIRVLAAELAAHYRNYELVVIDDRLAPEVIVELREMLAEVPCLRVLRLSRRSSPDTAVFAGLDAAIGDFVVVTALAYDPPSAVLDVVELLRSGHVVVQGEHTGPLGGGLGTRLGRRAFYFYNQRFLGLDIPSRSTYLTGLTRTAVNGVSAVGRTHRYIRHLVRYVGYRVHPYRYAMQDVRLRRARVRPKWLDAIEMVSSYSVQPLRLVTLLGLLGGGVSLLYGAYAVVVKLTRPVAEGWFTTSLLLSVMFFLVTLILAVQAEYVGRILSESRREAAYFVVEEMESDTLLAEVGRRNVAAV